jgi:hypothetical protein
LTEFKYMLGPEHYPRIHRLARTLRKAGPDSPTHTRFELGIRRALSMLAPEQWEAAWAANEAEIENESASRKAFAARQPTLPQEE